VNSPAYPIIGVDPDAFCSPDLSALLSIPFMKRGWVIANYPVKRGSASGNWKSEVASLVYKRYKNKDLSEMQKSAILAWLEQNRVDYHMLPPGKDPRLANIECEWNDQWGWTRNAFSFLNTGLEVVISSKEQNDSWGLNPKWRQITNQQSVYESVPELDEDERTWNVRLNAKDLAALVAHPLSFGNFLKMIDPHADYERWHSTLDAMLHFANPGIIIELHCSRKNATQKGADGPSDSFRNAWANWAKNQSSKKISRLSVFFWEELDHPLAELHDRHVIIGASTSRGSEPFAGVSVGKGWDELPKGKRHLETSFSLMSRKDQKIHWKNYSAESSVFKRYANEDVLWHR
jgi:hypothetical protein